MSLYNVSIVIRQLSLFPSVVHILMIIKGISSKGGTVQGEATELISGDGHPGKYTTEELHAVAPDGHYTELISA